MPHPVKFLKSADAEFLALPLPIQNDIVEKLRILAEFPYSGAPLDQAYEGYCSLLAWKRQYRIIYQVREDGTVEIAYIRHCRRQMGLRVVH